MHRNAAEASPSPLLKGRGPGRGVRFCCHQNVSRRFWHRKIASCEGSARETWREEVYIFVVHFIEDGCLPDLPADVTDKDVPVPKL